MKKLITIVLILALLLPAAAWAEDPDPIVGCWFFNMLTADLPPSVSAGDIIREINILVFDEAGNIYSILVDFRPTGAECTANTIGKWEKSDSGYAVKIATLGDTDTVLRDGRLLIMLHNPDIYTAYEKMPDTDIYTMYIRR